MSNIIFQNKNQIILSLILILFILSISPGVFGTCTETDNGEDYYNKGTVNFNGQTYTDYCQGTKNLVEYYCSADTLVIKGFTCDVWCHDGACSFYKCADECLFSGKKCKNSNTIEVCENTDIDDCMEYSEINCNPNEICAGKGTCISLRTCPTQAFSGKMNYAHDLDNDNLCEDVNGNYRLDFDDAVTLAKNLNKEPAKSNPEKFDFNLNGRIDFDDAVALAKMAGSQPKPTENKKNIYKYEDKQAFLISDENWQDVLSLVPVTTWTEKDVIHTYPTLIYHKEQEGFDVDSIIHFFQQYKPKSVEVIGNYPLELIELLIAEPEHGAGLEEEQITYMDSGSYLNYWYDYKDVVFVENNYSLALMASTYASLINAPLIIENSLFDKPVNYKDRNIICVGNVGSTVECDESYNLKKLQKKYIEKTNTDKIILVNPNDLNIKVREEFTPEKSGSPIYNLYSKTSLGAPILAGAKHELILESTSSNHEEVNSIIEDKINTLIPNASYLTIYASPDAIQMTRKPAYNFEPMKEPQNMYEEVDNSIYGDLNEVRYENHFQELAVGRIFGLTSSDVSSYTARDLFYNEIPNPKNFAVLWAPDFANMIGTGKLMDKLLTKAGFTEQSIYAENLDGPRIFNPKDFENKFYLNYLNHGWYGGGGNGYTTSNFRDNKVWLSPSVVVSDACSTCAYDQPSVGYKNELFCTNIIRRGALAYVGNVESSAPNWDITRMLLEEQLQSNDLGTAMKNVKLKVAVDPIYNYDPYSILLGDPTFNFNLKYPSNIEKASINVDKGKKIITISLPEQEKTIAFDFPLNSLAFHRGMLFEPIPGEIITRDFYFESTVRSKSENRGFMDILNIEGYSAHDILKVWIKNRGFKKINASNVKVELYKMISKDFIKVAELSKYWKGSNFENPGGVEKKIINFSGILNLNTKSKYKLLLFAGKDYRVSINFTLLAEGYGALTQFLGDIRIKNITKIAYKDFTGEVNYKHCFKSPFEMRFAKNCSDPFMSSVSLSLTSDDKNKIWLRFVEHIGGYVIETSKLPTRKYFIYYE